MRTKIVFVLLAVFFLGVTLVWIARDRVPPAWDDAIYMNASLSVYDALTDGGVPAFIQKSLSAMTRKPPLIAVLPTPLYLLFGRDPRFAPAINLLFLALMFFAVNRIAVRCAGTGAGLTAVWVAGTMPMIYAMARWYLVESGLIALVCVCVWLLIELDAAYSTRKMLLLGVACGCGLLMKASFPLYVVVPALFLLVRRGATLRRWPALRAFLIPAAVLVAPWYLLNLQSATDHFVYSGSASTAQHYGSGSILSASAIWTWLVNVANAAPILYVLLLCLLLAGGLRSLDPAARRGLILCGLWASPIVVIAFTHFRDVRFAAPLFPALAIANGILLAPWLRRPAMRAAAVVVLALPLIGMVQTSFRTLGNWQFSLAGLLLEPARFSYARPYDRAAWPQPFILADILRTGDIRSGQTKQLLLASDKTFFNTDNFRLAAAVNRMPFEVVTSSYSADRNEALQRAHNAAYVVFEEGGEQESSYNPFAADIVRELRDSGSFAELPFAHAVPDGGVARVFANLHNGRMSAFFAGGLAAAERAARVPPCKVSFGDRIHLTGFSLQKTSTGLQADFRWECVRPVRARFMAFVHVLGEGDKATNRDHYILNDEPPINTWPAGATAFETLQIPYSECPPGNDGKLIFGLYRPDTGERLPIFASTLPLTDNQSAVLAAVAP